MNLVTIEGSDGLPPEPDWSAIYSDELDIAAARDHWRTIVSERRENEALTLANSHQIQRAVQFRVAFDKASKMVAEQGLITRATRTKVPQVNPNWPIMRQAAESARIEEAELGISPVRRGKVTKVQKKTKVARAADAYLKPVAK